MLEIFCLWSFMHVGQWLDQPPLVLTFNYVSRGTAMKLRSHKILSRPEWSMNRAFYKSMGYSDYDIERPMIGIANSWNRVVPGHYNLNHV